LRPQSIVTTAQSPQSRCSSELKLRNPTHVKAVSGRKTDVRDAQWLARLVECNLVEGSFVPPREIRELRDVTRYRRRIIEERGRELQRLQKLLEDAQVKLDSVVSDINGVTARLILQALCEGERDPDVLADLAKRKLRRKIPSSAWQSPGGSASTTPCWCVNCWRTSTTSAASRPVWTPASTNSSPLSVGPGICRSQFRASRPATLRRSSPKSVST
jgi:hypothetical protein